MALAGDVVSTREVRREQTGTPHGDLIASWIKELDLNFFQTPTTEEGDRVAEIFAVQHFHALISTKVRLSGRPCADPWLIAKAWTEDGCVVTQEQYKPNSAKVPNVCEHFGVESTNFDGFYGARGLEVLMVDSLALAACVEVVTQADTGSPTVNVRPL